MKNQRLSLWMLMLLSLVLLVGCDKVIEVSVVTKTATPAPSTPTATVVATHTHTPTATPVPPTATPPVATATPRPPTATPQPPAPATVPGPKRIQFEPGATSATVSGQMPERGVDRYVLRALAGQTMEVAIQSPRNDVLLTLMGADGTTLRHYIEGQAYWRGPVPATQDYFIDFISIGPATTYELRVTIPPLSPGEPRRIQFQPGATSATVASQIEQQGLERWVLGALGGQMMTVSLASPKGDVLFNVVGADGVPMKRYVDGETYWRGQLPATQDYFIEAISVGDATEYELMVTICARIEFEPGTTWATVSGHVEPKGAGCYVVRAFAGQRMEVTIRSPQNDVLLTIVGADGVPLKRYVDGEAQWRGQLHSTQDYFIQADYFGEQSSAYELTVSISPLSLPEPMRIQFQPGATSATVQGTLEPSVYHRYVLRALRGQTMEVHVAPGEAIDIAVKGQDGSFWSAYAWESVLIIGTLPTTQDYVITLATVPPAGTTHYTMEVRVF